MDSLGSAYRDKDRQFGSQPPCQTAAARQQNRAEAISQLEAIVKVSTEVLGPEHRDTVANQATLAKLRDAQAREAS